MTVGLECSSCGHPHRDHYYHSTMVESGVDHLYSCKVAGCDCRIDYVGTDINVWLNKLASLGINVH